MRFDDPTGNCETEARTLLTTARSVGSVKTVEYVREIRWCDARTAVFDAEFRLPATPDKRNIDFPAVGRVLQRVIEQNHQQLPQPIRITQDVSPEPVDSE